MLIQLLLPMLRWALGTDIRVFFFFFFLIFAKILSLILETVFYYYLLKARDESVPTGGDVPTNQPSGSTVVPVVATPSGTNVSSIDFDLGDRN